MKNIINMSLMVALITILTINFAACGSDDDKDMTPPAISADGIVANPVNCQQYHPGDIIPFHYIMTDNQELGNYNIEIHNNFDHHTHGTSSTECPMETKKVPVSPWIYNKDFTIPAGQRTHTARIDIAIPADIDSGDYHFMIRLTDRAGWQQLKAMAIKVE